MARKEPIPDSILKQKVTQQLANRGLRTPCRINVDVRKGILTMSGHVLYPHQRDAAMAAVRSVDGLMRVVEQIQIRPPAKHQYKTLPPLPKKTENEGQGGEAEANEAAAAETSPAEGAAHREQPESAPSAPAAATAEDESDSTEFDLGPVKAAEQRSAEPAHSAPAPKAGLEDDLNETDFDLGPAQVVLGEHAPSEPATAGRETLGDVAPEPGAIEDDSSTTDFDLGPAPVKLRSAASDSAA